MEGLPINFILRSLVSLGIGSFLTFLNRKFTCLFTYLRERALAHTGGAGGGRESQEGFMLSVELDVVLYPTNHEIMS